MSLETPQNHIFQDSDIQASPFPTVSTLNETTWTRMMFSRTISWICLISTSMTRCQIFVASWSVCAKFESNFGVKTADISGFSKWKKNSTCRFGISRKNRINHPRGFFKNIFLSKKKISKKLVGPKFFFGVFLKKYIFSRNYFSFFPRGWLWWFFSLISNLPVEYFFTSKILRYRLF